MPRTKKVVQSSEHIEAPIVDEPADNSNKPTSLSISKEDYLKARATIKQYNESKKSRPKRKCSDKQLAALAAGRARNQRFKHQVEPAD